MAAGKKENHEARRYADATDHGHQTIENSVPRLFFPASMGGAKLGFSCCEFHKQPSTSFLEDLFPMEDAMIGRMMQWNDKSLHWTLRTETETASDVLLRVLPR